jgi:hypothetical protein
VPREALVQRNGHSGVFLVDPTTKTAKFVPVEVDIRTSDLVSVTDEGLSGTVVTLGHHLLSDGTTLILSTPSTPADDTPSDTTPARKAQP